MSPATGGRFPVKAFVPAVPVLSFTLMAEARDARTPAGHVVLTFGRVPRPGLPVCAGFLFEERIISFNPDLTSLPEFITFGRLHRSEMRKPAIDGVCVDKFLFPWRVLFLVPTGCRRWSPALPFSLAWSPGY